ncbi:tyrosinase family protein [Planosporangium flavigriseum]|uniref:Tyrosinase n=1 Tax=Planosporangium flavigriseum TaxID=373681 RepID=A0A8J3LPF5_9ACTN|nr:tyrosinase family protein [Planosporangium flavigriseum]NJC64992.1 tyrosinase family protein [Planosporangium flavigriseum]GIG71604.1 tyrosinase [Planosporangium flavigriseum]
MGTRKNQIRLSASEKRAFVNAVIALKRRGGYDDFVRTHNNFILSDQDSGPRVAHRSPSFGPWHRQFLLEFERALQSIDPSVNLPYWDWTTDRSPTSSLWAPDFLGGNGRRSDQQVTTGPFAYQTGNWTLTVRVDSRQYLCRNLGASGQSLPTAAEVRQVLAITPYDAPPWNSGSSGFRNQLEGWQGPNIHNRVHAWIGGHMASGVSPNDPVFWLHHCFVDKLWADWQAAHPDQGYLPASTAGGTPQVVSLDDRMRPWGDVTPRDLLDHRTFYEYA